MSKIRETFMFHQNSNKIEPCNASKNFLVVVDQGSLSSLNHLKVLETVSCFIDRCLLFLGSYIVFRFVLVLFLTIAHVHGLPGTRR